MTSTLETPRLRLEPLTRKHRHLVVELYSNPAVVGGWGVEPLEGERLDQKAEELFVDWRQDGFCQFVICVKESGELVGIMGMRPGRQAGEGELGYVLAPRAWGKGFATEAAGACVAWAFDSLHLDSIIATGISNPASMRVVEKLGFSEAPQDAQDAQDKPGARSYELGVQSWTHFTKAQSQRDFRGLAPDR